MNRSSIAGIAVALLLCASCSSKEGGQKPAGNYPTAVIDTTSQVLKTNFSATVKGRQTVEIRPQVQGLLSRINIREGDAVKKGQVLFEIEPSEYQAAYDVANANVLSAEAAVATAELVYDSNRDLFKENVISEFELNTSKNDLSKAKAQLALAKAERDKAATSLGYTHVKSPVDGVASMIPYRVGALVSSNISDPLVTVSDAGEVHAYFSMSENRMLEIIGQYGSIGDAISGMPEVELQMSNGTLYPHKGRIDAISGTIDDATGAVSFRAAFPNPEGILRDGATGAVVIPYEHTGVIVIPQTATYELQERVFVYKVVDGKASSTEIKINPQNNGTQYIVTEGLVPGDMIITEGAGLIKEGTEITNNTEKK